MLKVGVIIWNSFQLSRLKTISHSKLSIRYYIECRNYSCGIDVGLLPKDSVFFERGSITEHDGDVEVFISHTPVEGIWQLKKSKIVFLQYGLAKEKYNYALWRGAADLNLVYGPYSQLKLKGFAVASIVGYCSKHGIEPDSAPAVTAHNGRLKVMVAPSWDDVCPLKLQKTAKSLSKMFDVGIALHHNSKIFQFENFKGISNLADEHIFLANSDDLPNYKLLVTDHSGILFDGLFHGLGVFLGDFSKSDTRTFDNYKISLDSIEFAHPQIQKYRFNDIEDLTSFILNGSAGLNRSSVGGLELVNSLIVECSEIERNQKIYESIVEMLCIAGNDDHKITRLKIREHLILEEKKSFELRSAAESERGVYAKVAQLIGRSLASLRQFAGMKS